MTAKEVALAMHPFQQVHRTDKTDVYNNEGSGLGLPLTLKLVEAQGCSLLIESKPGVGTVASVVFPADKIVNLA
jgi:signal transduction histidine kinase